MKDLVIRRQEPKSPKKFKEELRKVQTQKLRGEVLSDGSEFEEGQEEPNAQNTTSSVMFLPALMQF